MKSLHELMLVTLVALASPAAAQTYSITLAAPTTTVLGGVVSATASAHHFMTGIDTTGTPTFAQPGLSDLSGVSLSGNTTVLGTTSGTLTTGHCVSISSGNLVDAGGACTTSGGGGTVSSGTANELTWYSASGTSVSGLPTAANGVLVTNGSGVPSISTTLPPINGSTMALSSYISAKTEIDLGQNAGSGTGGLMRFANGATNYIESGVNFSSNSAADLAFSSMMGTTEWMRIQGSTGYVGIGTNAPYAPLEVKAGTNLHLGILSAATGFGGSATDIAIEAYNDGKGVTIPLDVESSALKLNTATGATVTIGGATTINGAVSITTPTGLANAVYTHQNLSGYAGTSTQGNDIHIGSDTVNAGSGFLNGLTIDHYFGGSTLQGGREVAATYGYLTSPTSGSNSNRNYVGFASSMFAQSGDGGTSSSDLRGAFFAYGGQAILCGSAITAQCPYGTPATNVLNLTFAEANVSAQAGSSVYYKSVLQLASLGNDAVQGTSYDGELSISNQAGAVGWRNGILFSDANGAQPVSASGALIRTQGNASVGEGIDFSSYTFSGNPITVPGFSVSNGGFVYANGYASRAGTNGGFTGNQVNIQWDGSRAHLWIDNVDVGFITVTAN